MISEDHLIVFAELEGASNTRVWCLFDFEIQYVFFFFIRERALIADLLNLLAEIEGTSNICVWCLQGCFLLLRGGAQSSMVHIWFKYSYETHNAVILVALIQKL